MGAHCGSTVKCVFRSPRRASLQVSYIGLRVGEAAIPGPHPCENHWKAVPCNVASLRTQLDVAALFPAHFVALQETIASEMAQRDFQTSLSSHG